MMLFSPAHAQDLAPASAPSDAAAGAAPEAGSLLTSNLMLIVILVAMFYFLLIRPQQKRFKEHSEMLDALKKGDKVVTAGGLVGKVDKIEKDEIVVDLGNNVKVTALRHTIQSKADREGKADKADKKDKTDKK